MFISWEITGPRKNGKGRDGETCKGFRLQREDVGSMVWRSIPMALHSAGCPASVSPPQAVAALKDALEATLPTQG